MSRTVEVMGCVAGLAVLAALGCAAGERDVSGTVVRDSAGVSIVENTRPLWTEGQGWSVDEEPRVRIGVLDGPEEYQLDQVWSAARLADGRLVVANGGTNELRFYDPAGQHLISIGRTGEGPGEFRGLQGIWILPGDSILAYDFMPARLTVFGPDGKFVRSLRVISPEGRQVIVKGPFGDGSLIAETAPLWRSRENRTGPVRDSVPYHRFDAAGDFIANIGSFPSLEAYLFSTPNGWRMTSLPFPRTPIQAVSGNHLYFGPADAYEVQVYGATGHLERLIRLSQMRRPVTEADIASFRGKQLKFAEREGTRPAMERLLGEIPYPESMPPYDQLVVDEERNLWIADYAVSSDEERIWRVFSPEGAYLGVVRLPHRLELLQIGSDFVLGQWSDDLDVEYIQVHALRKP